MFRFRREVYLDNNATTSVSKTARTIVNRVLKHCYGNPSSLYKIARNAAEILEDSRRQVAETINAGVHEIYFTGSATEANNTIIKSVGEHCFPGKNTIVATPIEHASVMSTLEYLGTRGFEIEFCPVDEEGRVNPEALEALLDDRTCLVCCMLANNETGTVQDLPAIARLAKKHGIYFMADCVQALGKIPVDVQALGLDYASFSAHKIHGPKGVGALFVKEDCPFSPLIHGGHQEQGKRAGTEGLHNIAGFAAACAQVPDALKKAAGIAALRNSLIEGLKNINPDIIVNSPRDNCLPNTVSVTFPASNNAIFMAMLDYNGIAVSAGSACNTQEDKPSHVLKAVGLTDQQARQTLRFSLSSASTPKDIAYVLTVIKEYLQSARTPISVITPGQLNENILFDENTFVLDVRFWHDRKMMKGLPGSSEASFISIRKYLHAIPRDKNILAVCQIGYNSPVVAYYLKSKNYKNVSFLLHGLVGWRLMHGDLYEKYAGQDIVKLEPA